MNEGELEYLGDGIYAEYLNGNLWLYAILVVTIFSVLLAR
jgi:hypothetical protein